jgi:serine/threonine protein kinase
VLLVCPNCLTASSEDTFCPNDGTRLVEPSALPSSAPDEAQEPPAEAGISHRPVPLVRKEGPSSVNATPDARRAVSGGGDPLIGQLVAGRYRVLSQLGEGGMGNVYRAVQESIEKKVALKVLKAEYSASPDMVVRFQREAVSACRIKHPNVVDVFDLGQLEDGRFFLAMDLLEGRDLAQLIAATGPLSAARGVHLALQICRALNAAHQSGIVHRDLKPENIFLHRTSDGDEIVKIVDFGIAHLLAHGADLPPSSIVSNEVAPSDRLLTRVGSVFGTPEYMAPEQAQGMHIDHRADIYATGVILFKIFTGQTPFSGSSFLEIIARQVNEPPPRMSKVNPQLDIPKELEQVILQALSKNKEDRFENMARFAQAIAYASRDIRRSRSRAKRVAWFSAATVLTVLSLASALWLGRHRLSRGELAAAPSSGAVAPPPSPSLISPAPPALPPTAALPAPDLLAPTAAPPPTPSVASAPSSYPARAALDVRSAEARSADVRKGKTPRLPADAPGGFAPSSPTHQGAAGETLPQLERCFETVEGERRQVPCP